MEKTVRRETKTLIRNIIKEEIKLVEDKRKRSFTDKDVNSFIRDVMKLGFRNNIIDKYMRETGIKESELSEFLEAICDTIKKKWIL